MAYYLFYFMQYHWSLHSLASSTHVWWFRNVLQMPLKVQQCTVIEKCTSDTVESAWVHCGTDILLHCCPTVLMQCCIGVLSHCYTDVDLLLHDCTWCTSALLHSCTFALLHHCPETLFHCCLYCTVAALPHCPDALFHHCPDAALHCCTVAPLS